MSQNFSVRKDGQFDSTSSALLLKIPVVPNVTLISVQPEGSLVYDKATLFVYVSTGTAWLNTAGGNGDVTGPASSTLNAAALYSGTTGKIIKNSALIVGASSASIANFNSTVAGGFTYTGTTAAASNSGGNTATLHSKAGVVTFIDSPAIGAGGGIITYTITNNVAGTNGLVTFASNNAAPGSALAVQAATWTQGVSITVSIVNTGASPSTTPISHQIQFISFD